MGASSSRGAVIGYERGTAMANSVYLFALRDGTGDRAGTLLPWLAGSPSPHGVPDRLLVAACAPAAVSGPWVVHPDAYRTVCVVWPGARPDVLAGQWDRTAAGRR
jgi:hypothetical protein